MPLSLGLSTMSLRTDLKMIMMMMMMQIPWSQPRNPESEFLPSGDRSLGFNQFPQKGFNQFPQKPHSYEKSSTVNEVRPRYVCSSAPSPRPPKKPKWPEANLKGRACHGNR